MKYQNKIAGKEFCLCFLIYVTLIRSSLYTHFKDLTQVGSSEMYLDPKLGSAERRGLLALQYDTTAATRPWMKMCW